MALARDRFLAAIVYVGEETIAEALDGGIRNSGAQFAMMLRPGYTLYVTILLDGENETVQLPEFTFTQGYPPDEATNDDIITMLRDHIAAAFEDIIQKYEQMDDLYMKESLEASQRFRLYAAAVPPAPMAGACEHTARIAFGSLRDGHGIRADVVHYATDRSNSCLLFALSYHWHSMKRKRNRIVADIPNLVHRGGKKKSSVTPVVEQLRRSLGVEGNTPISLDVLPMVADVFRTTIELYDQYLDKLGKGSYPAGQALCTAHIVLHDNHYYLLRSQPKAVKGGPRSPWCQICCNIKCQHLNAPVLPAVVSSMEDTDISEILSIPNHILIHGAGGTGKSYIVRQLKEHLGDEALILAPTNMSAMLIQGRTIYSFLRLQRTPSPAHFEKLRKNVPTLSDPLHLDVTTIILDEASMIPAETFSYLDLFLKVVHHSELPFGGVRMIIVADFLQLRPVRGDYLFFTQIWNEVETNLVTINLRKPRRFTDPIWAQSLLKLREGECTPDIKALLETRVIPAPTGTVILHGKNEYVKMINLDHLRQIAGEEFTYRPQGPDAENYSIFKVKTGARVILETNIWRGQGIVNGSTGEVVALSKDEVTVRFDDIPLVHFVVTYVPVENKTRIMPLSLAYALSIHKCQGKTLSRAVIHLSKKNSIFCSNQAYVAVSRLRSLDGLYIIGHVNTDVFYCDSTSLAIQRWCMTFPRPPFRQFFHKSMLEPHRTYTLQANIYTQHPDEMVYNDIKTNTLYFDFETYFDGEKEVPYFNYIVHHRGKLEPRTWLLCKFCSPQLDVGRMTLDILMGIVADQCEQSNTPGKRKTVLPPLRVCAYNGSAFDFQFLMKYMLRDPKFPEKYTMKCTMKGSRIVIFRLYDKKSDIQRCCLQFHDLCLILTLPLAIAAKEFLQDDSLQKDIFPHFAITPDVVRRCPEEIAVKKSDFPTNGFDEPKYLVHRHLHSYGMQDVNVLIALYHEVFAIFQRTLQTSLFNFSTAAKATWYGFTKTFIERRPLEVQEAKCRKHKTWKQHNKSYNLPLSLLTRYQDSHVEECVIGGRCYPRVLWFNSIDSGKPYAEIEDYYVDLDICSMYVHIMMSYRYPYGNCQYGSGTLFEATKNNLIFWHPQQDPPYGLFHVQYTANERNLEPPLATKCNNKLVWDNVGGNRWMTNIDLFLLLKAGCEIQNISEWFVWEKADYIIRDWATQTFTQKAKAEAEGLKGLKTVWKLLGNACYGAMLQRDFNNELYLGDQQEPFDHFMRTHKDIQYLNIDDFLNNENSILGVLGDRIDVAEFELCRRPRYLGAFTLSYSRLMFHEIMGRCTQVGRHNAADIQFQPLYGDTDSVFIHASKVPLLCDMLGKQHGELSDELGTPLGTTKITGFAAIAPKCYAIQGMKADGQILEKVKTKGIPRQGYTFQFREEQHAKFTFSLFEAIVKDEATVSVRSNQPRLMPKGVKLNATDRDKDFHIFDITRQYLERSLGKTKWQGRREITSEEAHRWGLDEKIVRSRRLTVPLHFRI